MMQNLEEIKMVKKFDAGYIVMRVLSQVPTIVVATTFHAETRGCSLAAIATRNPRPPIRCLSLGYV